jgi:hypothetical protein
MTKRKNAGAVITEQMIDGVGVETRKVNKRADNRTDAEVRADMALGRYWNGTGRVLADRGIGR